MNQPMRILIAYDGSSGADAALADLQRAGFPNEVEAIVLCCGRRMSLANV